MKKMILMALVLFTFIFLFGDVSNKKDETDKNSEPKINIPYPEWYIIEQVVKDDILIICEYSIGSDIEKAKEKAIEKANESANRYLKTWINHQSQTDRKSQEKIDVNTKKSESSVIKENYSESSSSKTGISANNPLKGFTKINEEPQKFGSEYIFFVKYELPLEDNSSYYANNSTQKNQESKILYGVSCDGTYFIHKSLIKEANGKYPLILGDFSDWKNIKMEFKNDYYYVKTGNIVSSNYKKVYCFLIGNRSFIPHELIKKESKHINPDDTIPNGDGGYNFSTLPIEALPFSLE